MKLYIVIVVVGSLHNDLDARFEMEIYKRTVLGFYPGILQQSGVYICNKEGLHICNIMA